MTNKECAEILKEQCAYAGEFNLFYPLKVDPDLLREAVNHAINVLEETLDESDYERGMNDIWEALRCCNDMELFDKMRYYEIKHPVNMSDILREHTFQEFMVKHKAAMEKKESETTIKRGDMVKCVTNECTFDVIYLGEDDDTYCVLQKGCKVPQYFSKSNDWTLIKYEGKHVDLDSIFDE